MTPALRGFTALAALAALAFQCERREPVVPVAIGGATATGGARATGGASTGGTSLTQTDAELAPLECDQAFAATEGTRFPLGAKLSARPLGFKLEPQAPLVPVLSRQWEPLNPTPLKQVVGSCVGYSEDELASTFPGIRLSDTKTADELYHLATCKYDSFAGCWPPDDSGSVIEAGAKAAIELGLLKSYRVVYTIEQIDQELQFGPGIMASPWSTSMFKPVCGLIHYDPSRIEGGHAWALTRIDVKRGRRGGRNTWGTWGARFKGQSGFFELTEFDFRRLLEDGAYALFPVR